jgi:hypothetical protein
MDGGLDAGGGSIGSGLLGFVSLFMTKFASPSRPTLTQSVRPSKRKAGASKSSARSQGYSEFTLEEVSAHNAPDDCWIIVDGKVHDVSNLQHPGAACLEVNVGQGGKLCRESRLVPGASSM